jgi:GlpG protein
MAPVSGDWAGRGLAAGHEFGSQIETRLGSWRMALLVLAVALVSNVGQAYFSGPWFGGMSGVVYGLFGYAWFKSRLQPELGIFVHPNTVTLLLLWLVLCMTGLMGNVANWAHGLGLATGVVIAYAPIWYRRLRG